MSDAGHLAIIGHSLVEVFQVWSQLQPFFRSGDLLADAEPVGRAFDALSRSAVGVILIVDREDDWVQLRRQRGAQDDLLVLYSRDLTGMSAEAGTFAAWPIEDAVLALMGTEALLRYSNAPCEVGGPM